MAKTKSYIKRELTTVTKSGNTTKTKYPVKTGSGGKTSQLTKVMKSYTKKK